MGSTGARDSRAARRHSVLAGRTDGGAIVFQIPDGQGTRPRTLRPHEDRNQCGWKSRALTRLRPAPGNGLETIARAPKSVLGWRRWHATVHLGDASAAAATEWRHFDDAWTPAPVDG